MVGEPVHLVQVLGRRDPAAHERGLKHSLPRPPGPGGLAHCATQTIWRVVVSIFIFVFVASSSPSSQHTAAAAPAQR